MKFAGLKTTLIRGLTLAVPLAIVVYVLIRMIQVIRKIITPFSTKIGIHRMLGNATLTILAVLLILIFIFLLGLLMQISFISETRQQLENTILKFVPSLNYLKLMAADKLEVQNSQNSWKPVLVFSEEKYSAAFIVEETETLVTLFVSKGTSLKEGEILTANKKDVQLFPATYEQLNKFSRGFGKGFISIIENKRTN
jgi:uncharacterized membrane protein